ncbi:MAG: DUF3883 domain-containing protein [Gammaproteobacteria bacterium]|nr:DUF3883 domain-containing protein [Gammaproteobacteria bacterium]
MEATVQDYLDMLSCELRREPFNKAAHNRALRQMLDGRSHGAVERKHQNISAVLIGFGFPSIDGYKPLRNVQGLLRDIVRERLAVVENLVKADVAEPQAPVVVDDLLGIQVDPPRPTDSEVRQRRLEYGTPGSPHGWKDYLRQETLNRSLGDAGEALVMDYERLRLERAGKDHLARDIEQVSKTVGDHAGYDIRSHECNGRDRFIEVKTTRYGQHTPFYISAGELRFSNVHAESYHLYRLFGFRRMPRLFTLPGDVERHVRLQPMSYRAHL